jgi:large subunit ribosomal protein L11
MARKKVTGNIKLLIMPGAANPSPPVGPALGQKGVNIMDFCKKFNESTKDMDKTLKVPVLITVFDDRSFEFEVKTPPASGLILKSLKIEKGSAIPNKTKVGKLTKRQLMDIAKVKAVDLTASSIEAAMRSIAGTARSMGVEVEE